MSTWFFSSSFKVYLQSYAGSRLGSRADIGDEAGVASLQAEPHLVKGEVHGPPLPTLPASHLGTAYKFGSNSGGGKLVLPVIPLHDW